MARPETLRDSLPSLAHLLRFMKPYLAKERRLIAVSMTAMLAEVALRSLEPWPLKFVFDRVFAFVSTTAGAKPGAVPPTGVPLIDALDPDRLAALAALTALAMVVIAGLRAFALIGPSTATFTPIRFS